MNKLKMLLGNKQKINREDLLYKTGDTQNDTVYGFRKYKTMLSFGFTISNGIITLKNAIKYIESMLMMIMMIILSIIMICISNSKDTNNSTSNTRPRPPSRGSTQVRGIKIVLPKQFLQILPKQFTQVQAGNTSKDLLNEIIQIVYSLY